MDHHIKPKRVARIQYWHGAVLFIDGQEVVSDLDEKFGDPDTGEIDFEAELKFFRERGVTHVVDEELNYNGDFDKANDYEWPIDEYADALKQLNT